MSDSEPSTPDLSDLLWRLAFRYQREVLAAYEPYGVAMRGVRVLEVLERGPAAPATLARHMEMGRSSVTLVLDRLEVLGWVRRERADHDGREVRASLSAAGVEMMAKVKAARAAWLEVLLEGGSGAEREHLEEALALLVTRLETRKRTT